MSFNLDDPLAGILSDGSDDSFFDDDILGKKKPVKKVVTPIADKKNALFNLDDDNKGISDGKIDVAKPASTTVKKPTFDLKPKSPAPLKKAISKDSFKLEQKSHDLLDIVKSPAKTKINLSTEKLDIAPTKKEAPKIIEKGKSSQSLFDDILGPSNKSGSGPSSKPSTAPQKQDFDFDSIVSKSDTKPKVTNTPKQTDKTKSETQVKKTKASEDWLGIFQDKDDEEEDEGGMPSWLGGGSKKTISNVTPSKPAKSKLPEPEIDDEHEHIDVEKKEQPKQEEVIKPVPSTLIQSTEDMTVEGASMYLQQQESQLMVALQLKAQEEKLAALQMRQKERQHVLRSAALAQHKQLEAMKSNIAAQQERITQRIQDLLGSPTINDELIANDDQEFDKSVEKDTPHSREKKQLLQLVQSLQDNHDKEIDLMETSYRRQLSFLEVSLNQTEERMKEESEKTLKFYSEKINWLEEHHQLYKTMAEENLNSLSNRHKTEIEMLRQQHLDNVKFLQDHHTVLMENIKNAVHHEQALIKDASGFSSDLQELVSDVKQTKTQCLELVEKVQTMSEHNQRDTANNLQVRETQINDMIMQLKKERDNFDIEKNESREIVKLLESRLKQMTTMIEEETATLKQKKMEFDFEKATFSKQTEFAKNILKKQDEEMKILKESMNREYQDKINTIEEERCKAIKDSASAAKERAIVQSLKQELEKMKAELHAQMEEVSEERSKLNLDKQQLHMEDQRITAKSRDLDLLARSAQEKQSQADKKYSESEFVLRKYEERIRRVQEHVVSLNAREKQIAKEKIALSRERLSLHNERKQMDNKQQCSLCRTSQNAPQYHFDAAYTMPETLSYSVSRDYTSNTGNVNAAMKSIEEEMAHLMSANFDLRHSSIGNDVRDMSVDVQGQPEAYRDYMDPKFMMLRLDVQKVISNLEQSKNETNEHCEERIGDIN